MRRFKGVVVLSIIFLSGQTWLGHGQSQSQLEKDVKGILAVAWQSQPKNCVEALGWLVTHQAPKKNAVSSVEATKNAKNLLMSGLNDGQKRKLEAGLQDKDFPEWLMDALPAPADTDPAAQATAQKNALTAITQIYECDPNKLMPVKVLYTQGDYSSAFYHLLYACQETDSCGGPGHTGLTDLIKAHALGEENVFNPVFALVGSDI